MEVLYSPQRNDNVISYRFDNDIVIAEYLGKKDRFDFTNFPESAQINEIDTILDINPITSVKRKDGVLYLELIYFHGSDATEEELFPTWKEV